MGIKEKRGNDKKREGVLICGAYGQGNAGDDAILEAILCDLRGIDDKMPITVLSRRPKEARERFGVKTLHMFNIFSFLLAMRKTKLYVSGGGSLIQDVTSRRSLWYYLFSIAAAKRLGNRVIMYGCGIGPVTRGYNVALVRRVLNKYVDIITLREDMSLSELELYGVDAPEIILASDPALAASGARAEVVDAWMERAGLSHGGRFICFALRMWPGFAGKTEILAEAADYAYEKHGLLPVFLSINHRSDDEASDKVTAKINAPYAVLREPMEKGVATGVLSRMSVVAAMRLHGLILAAGQGVPIIGIGYDPKVRAFMRSVEQGLYVDFEVLSAEALKACIDEAVRPREANELSERAFRLAQLGKRSAEAAKRLLS